MTKQTGRKIFVNIGSLEIYCFGCNQEVFDEHLKDNKSKHKPIIALKKFMRDALKSAILKTFSSPLIKRELQVFPTDALAEFGVSFLHKTSMSNSFSATMYALWGIPYFRTILRRVYLIELDNLKRFGSLLSST